MKNVLLSLILLTSLTGCASFFRDPVEPITVVTKAEQKTPLRIAHPDPLETPKNIQWIVVTPDNYEAALEKIKESGEDPVVFGLTDTGYQQLSILLSEIRNFISIQRNIIIRYQEYYEPEIK